MGRRIFLTMLLVASAWNTAFPIEKDSPHLFELLNAPERLEIPCKASVEKPALMFQQQYLLEVEAEISAKTISRGALRHLFVETKLQDSDGQWLAGENFDELKIPEKLRHQALYYSTLIYLRPGRYRVSTVILDGESGKASIFHRDIFIRALENDPFPQMDQSLPTVEFPERLAKHRGFWRVSRQTQSIPVPKASGRPLYVVLNITKRFYWDALYRVDVQMMLESGSVLGRLHPNQGCVRLSVIDALRTKVVLDRIPTQNLNWTKLQELIEDINQDVIDVHQLENQRKVARFTHDYLEKLAGDTQCKVAAGGLKPLVVVVSPDLVLPDGNRLAELETLPHDSYVYLHEGYGGGWTDAMGQILSSAKPEKLKCSTPRQFREAVAKIASDL